MERFESLLARVQHQLEEGELDALLSSGALAELLELVSQLRRGASAAEALAASQQALRAVHRLAQARPWDALPAMVRATEELGRCSQRAGHHEGAVEAFAKSVESLTLLLETQPEAGLELALAEALSELAIAEAICGRLEPAHGHATRAAALARDQLPGGLPLLSGSLVLLADLAADLGREDEARAHVEDALRQLGDAVDEGLPGAAAAGQRLVERLRANGMLDALAGSWLELAQRLADPGAD